MRSPDLHAAVARLRQLAERARIPPEVARRASRLARSVPIRAAVAAACLAIQLVVVARSGERFAAPFNAAPGEAPRFVDPAREANPRSWNRLIVSRWDAGQYIELGLRGYQHCPPRRPDAVLPVGSRTCNLSFYPTYGLIGRVATVGGRIPIDYALFAISLTASFVFLFLWTGPALVDRLGLVETYLALLLFNVFTTGFALVTVQTEPLTLALTLGAFVAFTRRWWLLAGFLAGAATSMRITAMASGAACAAALIVEAWQRRPGTAWAWVRRAMAVALSGWGATVLMGYHRYRFGDALAYVHSHAKAFKHEPAVSKLLDPEPEWIVRSLENPLHEGMWLIGALLWFLLGRRETLRRFPPAEQAFWYALLLGTLGIAMVGLAPIGFVGMNRYLLLALPVFFAMAQLLKPRPLALGLWLVVSCWHYWHVDVCHYTGGPGNRSLQVCHTPHWIGRI